MKTDTQSLKNRGLGVYAFLARRNWPKSYLGKIMLVAFLGIHIPLLTLFFYDVSNSSLNFEVKLWTLLVALVATLGGMAITLFILNQLLKPITLTYRGLRQYLEKNTIPVLPTKFTDEAGILMADTMYTITRLDDLINQLKHNDPLTSLPNRTQFVTTVEQLLAAETQPAKAITLMIMDLDGFALINNSLGRQSGDLLLRQAAQRLQSAAQGANAVARTGSDEFAVVYTGLDSLEDVAARLQNILAAFTAPFVVEASDIYLSVCVGIATHTNEPAHANQLLENADVALRGAKAQGRNTYRFYSADMQAKARDWLELEQDLRGALERKEFELYYQPQVDVRNGKILGLEALLRWHHPTRGLIEPTRFIPIAEATGLIVPIGQWVLQQACNQNKAWQTAGLPKVRMAVNISAAQFNQPNLIDQVSEALRVSQLDPAYLELEITESLLMNEVQRASRVLQGLRNLGVTLALDDFGTGYSSLNYLKRFPIDVLKIDQSFVRGIPADSNDTAIVNSVIALAGGLGLQTLAEGVETQAQADYLNQAGCYNVQGFLFSRPVPAAKLEHLWLQPILGNVVTAQAG
jgi:diguanylate cyclase (GGDEF)-like protein